MNSAWLCLWNTIPPQNPRNLKVFVAKITRNIALNKIKAKNAEKRGGGEADVLIDELSECIASGENVEEKIDAKELGKIINRFAENLPERERNVFIRRYFFFESPETIGERYGISTNHVSVLLHRTRKKLRKNLEKEGYFQ